MLMALLRRIGGLLAEVVRPGRLVIADARDEFIERDEALGLFVVLLQLFAGGRREWSVQFSLGLGRVLGNLILDRSPLLAHGWFAHCG